MSKYQGLDKIKVKETSLVRVEKYQKAVIYRDEDGCFSIVANGYLVDDQINNLNDARETVDWFFSE